MAESLIEDVSDTAFMVAAQRALEGQRERPLFRDPLAGALAGEHGRKIVASQGRQARIGEWAMAIRTVVIDAYLRAALEQGVTLIANLGAGLDTRPYRMDLPDTLQWVEVDFPKIIALKNERLAGERPRCRLERVALDLSNGDARRRLLADLDSRAERILVLTEGVVPYLNVEEAASLADDLRSKEHFRLWIVDYFSPETRRYRQRQAAKRGLANAPFRFEPSDWFGLFREHGWALREIRYLAEEGKRLGRPLPVPMALMALLVLRGGFLSAERREELRHFTGYALLERG
ncbi:MAG TPA: SAM-dependent methyltransferase [Myxococcales bacterium]|nr:SAM-dependent methyltransferase [Myxococcales bacterium]